VSQLFERIVLKKLKKYKKQLNHIQEQLEEMENNMSVELDNLTVEVTEIGTVVDSAIVLLEGLSARLAEIANDPAAINALALELDTKSKELAAAVVANTPTLPVS
jgi:hypothetical protein